MRAGRQSGKSFAQSLRVALFSLLNPNTQTLLIGAVDRQSVALFEKVKSHIFTLAKHMVKGKDYIHKINLRNGSKIIALPAGRTGYGLRNYTIHKLVVDEAHYVPEEVWVAVRPMLATTGGTMDLLSTPRGNEGFFYEVFKEGSGFITFHTKSEDCPRITKEFLEGERRRMTKLQYLQEYEAEFLDSLQQFFPRELVDSCIRSDLRVSPSSQGEFYLGVDIARFGGDENAFTPVKMIRKDLLYVGEIETTEEVSIADTVRKIEEKHKEWRFRKIFIDDGGVGGGAFDFLIERPGLRWKIVAINNASRPIEADKSRGMKILKESLYFNLKRLMEMGEIKFPYNPNLINSLLSIQIEYNSETQRYKIHGRYDHITESLTRAVWCVKAKGLRPFVA